MKIRSFLKLHASAIHQISNRSQYLVDLVQVLVVRELKLRYQRSVLGIAWTLVNPLAQMLVFSFIFSSVLPLGIQRYTSFVFTGLLVWTWFQTSLVVGTGAIVDNRDLVRRPGFPLGILPVVTVFTNWINFLMALPVLFGFLLINQVTITRALFLLPVLFVVQFLFTVGLVYILAVVHVTFRDTQHLLGLALMIGFYLTPIVYDLSNVPDQLLSIYQLNPMTILISGYRAVLFEGRFPPLLPLVGLALASAVLVTIGLQVYNRGRSRYAEEL